MLVHEIKARNVIRAVSVLASIRREVRQYIINECREVLNSIISTVIEMNCGEQKLLQGSDYTFATISLLARKSLTNITIIRRVDCFRHGREDNIRMDLEERGINAGNCIDYAQDRDS